MLGGIESQVVSSYILCCAIVECYCFTDSISVFYKVSAWLFQCTAESKVDYTLGDVLMVYTLWQITLSEVVNINSPVCTTMGRSETNT